MRWHTYALFAVSSLWLLTPFLHQNEPVNIGVLAAYAAWGALVPDLDAAESKIKHLSVCGIKPFALPAVGLHRALGHRGLLHSFAGLAAFSLVMIPLSIYVGGLAVLALMLGYASHLVADACTRSGVPLHYSNHKRYHLLPRSCRFITSSQAEEVVFVLVAIVGMLLLLTHLPL